MTERQSDYAAPPAPDVAAILSARLAAAALPCDHAPAPPYGVRCHVRELDALRAWADARSEVAVLTARLHRAEAVCEGFDRWAREPSRGTVPLLNALLSAWTAWRIAATATPAGADE